MHETHVKSDRNLGKDEYSSTVCGTEEEEKT